MGDQVGGLGWVERVVIGLLALHSLSDGRLWAGNGEAGVVPSCVGFCSGCTAARFFLFCGVVLDVLAARFLAAIAELSHLSTG